MRFVLGKGMALQDEATIALFEGLDAVVFAFPEATLMRAAALAKVQWRVATGRRWAGLIWANLRSWRSRRNRPIHEALQGLRLLHRLALPAAWAFPEPLDWMGLTGLSIESPGRIEDLGAVPWSSAVVLHPGNHGSANGWSKSRFLTLAERLLSEGVPVIFTGTKTERTAFAQWLDARVNEPLLQDGMGIWSLADLMVVLGHVGVVVASSTGPLHIASALDTPVVGLYRADAPFWPERWAPLGPSNSCPPRARCPDGGLGLVRGGSACCCACRLRTMLTEVSARHARKANNARKDTITPAWDSRVSSKTQLNARTRPSPKGFFVVRRAGFQPNKPKAEPQNHPDDSGGNAPRQVLHV